ncbi:MAG: MBL fold metallo-hydrolase [Pseudomonadales bacterium]|nr:MBL fold metallo-hydrolase [Pseudomonadales bacterium]
MPPKSAFVVMVMEAQAVINKIKYSKLLRMFVFCILVLTGNSTAQDSERPPFKHYFVQGNVHMFEPANTNGNPGALVGDDGILLIDSHFDFSVEDLLASLREVSDQEINFVVNTHVHPDHMGGNNKLAAYGVTILAHDTVRLQMLEEIRIPRRGGTFIPAPPAEARPVITYSDAISFHLNEEEVRVFLAPPAHTGGDSFVYFKGSDVLHLGDVFRTNMYPIIDKYNGGSFHGMIEAMGLAIGMSGPNTKVIPGHGAGPSDRAGMIVYQDLLFTMRDRVKELKEEGMSAEQIVAAKPMADYDDRYGGVPSWTADDVIPIIYEELQEQ